MELIIKPLQNRDHRKAIRFAITGMHFSLYLQNRLFLALYGRYFWYSELSRASQVLAAYAGDELAGVLLADMNGEEKVYRRASKTLYVRLFEGMQRLFSRDGAGVYEQANQALLDTYLCSHKPDGQIVFLAADPRRKGNGTGTFLLSELERREAGKQVYLFTDDACTYSFYEHRGFQRVGEKAVELMFSGKKVPLTCFLYSKQLPEKPDPSAPH